MKLSLRLGILWAILLLGVSCLVIKPGSSWIVDDCVKRIAAQHGEGVWAEYVPDGPIRSTIATPNRFSPILPPFAERGAQGLIIGFSPLTRLLFKALLGCGELLYRMFPVLIVILFWALLERTGFSYAFLLLPLTFYGLVPWEHALSWLLLWPLVVLALQRQNDRQMFWILASISTAIAVLLRPETVILAAVVAGFLLIQKRNREFMVLTGCGIVVIGGFLLIHRVTAKESVWIQFTLNDFYTRGTSEWWQWLVGRSSAVWSLLLAMDESTPVSLALLIALGLAVFSLHKYEKTNKRVLLGLGIVLLVLWTAIYEYRLWSHPLPSLVLAHCNSLPATLPWIAVLLLPPYKGRHALYLFLVVALLAIISAPIWEGVHWGPRLMLFAVPLLLMDLRSTDRAKGVLFHTLLILTAVLTLTSAALVDARSTEMSDRTERLRSHLGSPVVCTMMHQCTDLAPLWANREIFRVSTPRELRQLAIQFREVGVDTFFLHLGAADRLLVQSFPAEGPIKPYRMTVVWAGNLYKTTWRVYELPMNRADTLWAGVLQDEAGELLKEHNAERSLRLQREAVELKPDDPQGHYNLGLILGTVGKENEASEEMLMALRLDSSFTPAKELLRKTLRNPPALP